MWFEQLRNEWKEMQSCWIYIKFTRFTFLICVFVNRVPRMYTFQHFLNRRTYVSTLTKKTGKNQTIHSVKRQYGTSQFIHSAYTRIFFFWNSCCCRVFCKLFKSANGEQKKSNNLTRCSKTATMSKGCHQFMFDLHIYIGVFYTIRGVALKG